MRVDAGLLGKRSAASWIVPPFLLAVFLSPRIACSIWLPLIVALICVAGATLGLSTGRRAVWIDILLLVTLSALGFCLGQTRVIPREVPIGVPELLVRANLAGDDRRRIAGNVQVYGNDAWHPLEGRFRCYGGEGPVGEIVASAWIAPLQEPRMPGLADPTRRDRTDRLRGKLILRRCWSCRVDSGRSASPWREEIRQRLAGRLGWRLSPRLHAMVARVVWGEREPLDPQLSETFRLTGTMHLLAISGLHLSLVVLMLEFLLRCFVRQRTARMLIVCALLLGYAFVVGPHPSVIRSTMMGIPLLIGRAYGTVRAAGVAWWWALMFMAAAFPGELVSVGGQLSFAATAALILAPRVRQYWSLPIASLAATASTAGIVLSYFGAVAPLAVGANLVGIPMLLPVLIAFLWGLLWGNPTSAFLQAIAWGPAELLARSWTSLLGALAPLGEATLLRYPCGLEFGLSATGLFLSALFLAGRVPGRAAPWILRVTGLVILCVTLGLPSRLASRAGGTPQAIILPVGQGDATLLWDGQGRAYLVDAGPGGKDHRLGERRLAPALRALGVDRLTAVFLTHGDEDHVGGLRGLLQAGMDVDTLFLSLGDSYELLLPRDRVPVVRSIAEGWKRRVGALRLELLAPPPGPQRALGNEGSMVLRVRGPGGALLLPGDLEDDAESILAEHPGLSPVSVQLAGHHGSRGSTGEKWCDRVTPRLVLVSCGIRNRHGHPSLELLDRLRRRRIEVHRTDREGCLRLRWLHGGLWFASDSCPTFQPVL